MKPTVIKGKYVSFHPTYHRATKTFRCDSCNGEWPILRGDMYCRSRVIQDGKFDGMRMCIRCCLALQTKTIHSKSADGVVQAGNGWLCWHRLSNTFKKAWTAFVKRVLNERSEEGHVKAQDELYRALGVKGFGRYMDEEVTQKNKMQKARREARKARAELKRAKKELADVRAAAVRAALACKVAWLKGEGYEVAHAALVAAIGGAEC